MKKQTALEFFGDSVSALAIAAGVSKSAVSQWGDVVPQGSAYKLQVVTAGGVMVDPELYKAPNPRAAEKLAVTHYELQRDVFGQLPPADGPFDHHEAAQ